MGIVEKIGQYNIFFKNWNKGSWFFYFLVIPILMLLIFISPDHIKNQLILFSNKQNLLNIFFNHYTHLSFIHLINNVFTYLITIFLIFNIEKSKKRLFLASAFFLLCVPFIISYLLLTLIQSNFQMQGFSAINSCYIGYLLQTAYVFLKNRYEYVKLSFFCLLISINLFMICIINNFSVSLTIISGFLAIFFLLLEYRTIKNLFNEFILKIVKSSKELFELIYLIFIVCFISVMTFSLPILMPLRIVENNMIVNTVGHYVGWMMGFLFPMFL